jgi:hypothetical protein
MAQILFVFGPARHRDHRYISVDILRDLGVPLGSCSHVSQRVGAAWPVGRLIVATYGNDDLGNLIVDAHDLGGCTGISGRHSWRCMKLGIISKAGSQPYD